MEPDTELGTWRRQWQSGDVIPSGLQQRVERETRHIRRARYGEIAVTVIMGGGATAWALISQRWIVGRVRDRRVVLHRDRLGDVDRPARRHPPALGGHDRGVSRSLAFAGAGAGFVGSRPSACST